MTKLEGPLTSAFESDISGVLFQELITYRVVNGMLRKEIVQRKFAPDGDYYDSTMVQPLTETKNG